MAESIVSKEKVIQELEQLKNWLGRKSDKDSVQHIIDRIDVLAGVDAAPVVHAGFKLTGYDEVWCTWGDCQGCGHSNMVGSRYCNRCGAKLELIT